MPLTQRKAKLLSLLLPILIALLFYSVSSINFRRAPWYEEVLWNLLEPPQRVLTAIGGGVASVWNHYVWLVGTGRERDELAVRVAELEGKLIAQAEVEQENARLHELLGFRTSLQRPTLVASVIASDPRAEFKSITIDRGADDGIAPLMPVIGPKGLVGKVGRVGPHRARVLLLIDPNSSVDAMVQRSRERGLVSGAAWRADLTTAFSLTRMEYLERVSDVQEGDAVVTSGLDGVFPPGIPIGTIHDVSASRYGVFNQAEVVPYENMAELQEVMVVLGAPSPEDALHAGGR
jgi:rod shape-determining protein MreC